MFAFLPAINKSEAVKPAEEVEPIGKSLAKFAIGFKQRESRYLLPSMFILGTIIGYYASFLSNVHNATLPAGADEKTANKSFGYVLMALAFGEVFAGISVGKVADKFNKDAIAQFLIVVVETALALSVVGYLLKAYFIVVVSGFLLGFCDTALNTILGSIIGSRFGGSLELFCIYRCLSGVGVMFGCILAIFIPGTQVLLYAAIMGSTIVVLHGLFNFLKTAPKTVYEKEIETPLTAASATL
jgi:MFS family permease